jgi:hypothetical protein
MVESSQFDAPLNWAEECSRVLRAAGWRLLARVKIGSDEWDLAFFDGHGASVLVRLLREVSLERIAEDASIRAQHDFDRCIVVVRGPSASASPLGELSLQQFLSLYGQLDAKSS